MGDATEAEWLTGVCPDRMYGVVRRRATTRQVRLYMVACCRLLSDSFFDPRVALSLAAAERCADDPGAEAELESAWHELVTSPRSHPAPAGPTGGITRTVRDVWQLLDEYWAGTVYRSLRHALAHAAYLSLRDRPGEVFTGGEGDAADYCVRAVGAAEGLRRDRRVGGKDGVRRRMADLLRDIFGNPFRPPSFDPRWRTADAVAVALGMYESGQFSAMPILADALQDGGCADEHLLGHCKGDGPHVRGCWAIDTVLGRV